MLDDGVMITERGDGKEHVGNAFFYFKKRVKSAVPNMNYQIINVKEV